MDRIRLYDKCFKPYIRFEEFEKNIIRVAERLNKDYASDEDIPILLCVMNGSLMFTAELMKHLTFNIELASVKLSSYVGTSSTGEVMVKQPLSADVKGRRVIIVEDIVDTGTTIVALKKLLTAEGVKDVTVCTLFYKPEAYKYAETDPVEYVSMEIENQFIVGFGLDYNELGRQFKDIYILDEN